MAVRAGKIAAMRSASPRASCTEDGQASKSEISVDRVPRIFVFS
jgi:hypothetical protein